MRVPGDPPESLTRVAATVDVRVDEVLAEAERTWTLVDDGLAEPFRSISQLVHRGGKRLRPAFCTWAFVGAGGDLDDPRVVDAGAALELLHAFALVHDDVMDGSDRRRGAATVHEQHAAIHRDAAWRGEPRRYGEGVAILAGDLAHVLADGLLADADPATRRVWNLLAVEVNVGQYLDLLHTAQGDTDLATARRIVRYKSGRYTIVRPLHLGAALAGRLEQLAEPLSRYGEPLGEAFQLRDDLLGAFGDPSRTGKPVGDDLREGKPTPLLALARAEADPSGAAALARVGDPTLDDDGLRAVQEALERSGARARVEAEITSLTDRALAELERMDLAGGAHEALAALAHYVGGRDR